MTKDDLQALHQNEFAFLLSTESHPIEELVRHFPYFSKAQEWLAKKYELNSDYRYELQLEKAAYFTHSRARLFDFISSKQTTHLPRVELAEVKVEKTAIDNFTDKASNPNDVKHINTSELVNQQEIEKKETDDKTVAVSELTQLNKEIQSNPINSISHTEASKEKIEDVDLNNSISTIDIANKSAKEIEVKEKTIHEGLNVLEPPLSLAEKREVKKLDNATEKRDFYEWLDFFSESNQVSEVSKNLSEIKQRYKKTDKKAFDALIDKFIAQEPRIEPKKKNSRKTNENIHDQVVGLNTLKPEKTENLAQNSLTFETLPASETLANLLVKQGNFRQAIQMYEKLQLTNQEKRTYFAALIEKLKNENNIQ